MRMLQEDSPAVPMYNPHYAIGARKRVMVPPGIPTAGEYAWLWKMDVS